MEDAAEHVLQFGTELEDSEQHRFHNNKGKEWEEKAYLFIANRKKRERKKRSIKQVEKTEIINTANTEEEWKYQEIKAEEKQNEQEIHIENDSLCSSILSPKNGKTYS